MSQPVLLANKKVWFSFCLLLIFTDIGLHKPGYSFLRSLFQHLVQGFFGECFLLCGGPRMLGWTQVINYCFPACPASPHTVPTFHTYKIELGPRGRGAGMGRYKYTRGLAATAFDRSAHCQPFSAPDPTPYLPLLASL